MPHDPFRRSRHRATVVRSQRIRRIAAGAAAAMVVGGFLLTLPGNATPVQPDQGQSIALVTHFVRHVGHTTYLDLVRQTRRGAALAGHRAQLPPSDFLSARQDIRYKIAVDEQKLASAETFLTGLDGLRDEWFHLYGGKADSPILGPAKLTAAEMAAYVTSTGVHVRTTVPILTLARMYLEEGEIEGVRGDVAFAQAIKETGDFTSSDVALNNFAGLGHCTGCGRGIAFFTARAGVRAQIQLLRWVADPTVRSVSDLFSQPATLPKVFLHLGHSHTTWTSLGGMWAPNPQYGNSIYDLFLRMYGFAQARDRIAHL